MFSLIYRDHNVSLLHPPIPTIWTFKRLIISCQPWIDTCSHVVGVILRYFLTKFGVTTPPPPPTPKIWGFLGVGRKLKTYPYRVTPPLEGHKKQRIMCANSFAMPQPKWWLKKCTDLSQRTHRNNVNNLRPFAANKIEKYVTVYKVFQVWQNKTITQGVPNHLAGFCTIER